MKQPDDYHPPKETSQPDARFDAQSDVWGENEVRYVDLRIKEAIRRGDFDNLPGAGKPLELGPPEDRDWWLKKLIDREKITGVLPDALQLRNDDLALHDRLDRESAERRVREIVQDFNARIVAARRQLLGGPPVTTPTRDVDAEVTAWRERRAAQRRTTHSPGHAPRRRRWWPRGR